MNDEIELRMWNQVSYDSRSYERKFSICVWKPEKFRTSTGFELTSVASKHSWLERRTGIPRSRVQTPLNS